MYYILKIKGTKKIPDFVQIRDKDMTLVAYFRLSQIEHGLKKNGIEKEVLEECENLEDEFKYIKKKISSFFQCFISFLSSKPSQALLLLFSA